jgi:hypothetical protein
MAATDRYSLARSTVVAIRGAQLAQFRLEHNITDVKRRMVRASANRKSFFALRREFIRSIEDSIYQRGLAVQLLEDAGVDLTKEEYDKDDLEKIYKFLGPRYSIQVFDHKANLLFTFSNHYQPQLPVLLQRFELRGRVLYDWVRSTNHSGHARCSDCGSKYSVIKDHLCHARCQDCGTGSGNCIGDLEIECRKCFKMFTTTDCYERHTLKYCDLKRCCSLCSREFLTKKGHQCTAPDSL